MKFKGQRYKRKVQGTIPPAWNLACSSVHVFVAISSWSEAESGASSCAANIWGRIVVYLLTLLTSLSRMFGAIISVYLSECLN